MTQNSFLIIKTKSTRTVFKFWVKLKYRFLKKKKSVSKPLQKEMTLIPNKAKSSVVRIVSKATPLSLLRLKLFFN